MRERSEGRIVNITSIGGKLGAGGIRSSGRTGRDSASRAAPSVLTRLNDRAALRNNEL